MIHNNNMKVNIFVSNVRQKLFHQHLILNTVRVSSIYKKDWVSNREPGKYQSKVWPIIVTDVLGSSVLEGTT